MIKRSRPEERVQRLSTKRHGTLACKETNCRRRPNGSRRQEYVSRRAQLAAPRLRRGTSRQTRTYAVLRHVGKSFLVVFSSKRGADPPLYLQCTRQTHPGHSSAKFSKDRSSHTNWWPSQIPCTESLQATTSLSCRWILLRVLCFFKRCFVGLSCMRCAAVPLRLVFPSFLFPSLFGCVVCYRDFRRLSVQRSEQLPLATQGGLAWIREAIYFGHPKENKKDRKKIKITSYQRWIRTKDIVFLARLLLLHFA